MPPEIKALMGQTATVYSRSAVDGYGEETFGTGRTITCYYVAGKGVVFDAEGKRTPLAYTLYTDDAAITQHDRMTVDGKTLNIAKLTVYYDDTGTAWGTEVGLL